MYDIREDILSVRTQAGLPVNDIDHQWNVDSRADYQLNSRNRFSAIWLYNEQNRYFRRDTAYSFVSDVASWRQIEPAYIAEALWTSQITNALTLDVRFGYMHQIFPLSYQPGVAATAINTVDLSLSTETGAAPYSDSNLATHTRGAATASYYKSGFLGGSHDLKFGYEAGTATNGYTYAINGDISEVYNNGNPYEVTVFNTPLNYSGIIRDAAAFVQDAWHIGHRLTLNVGVRFDHIRSFNPSQTSPASATYGSLFGARTFVQSPNVIDWNNFAPRLGAAYDLTGKGRSVIRGGWSRFYRIEGTELAQAVNPNTLSSKTYLWNGALANGMPTGFLTGTPVATSGGVFTTVDPNLSHPYSDQTSIAWQQQLLSTLSIGAAYYYRNNRDQIGRESTVRLPSDYTAITSINGTPIVNPITNQPLTLYTLNAATASLVNYYTITNIKELNAYSYNGVEFTATKRLSSKWMVLGGLTIQRTKGDYSAGTPNALSDDFNDPNRDINRQNNYLFLDSTYVWKINGVYEFPWKISTSLNFQHYTGYPFRPTEVFTGLGQGSETVALLPQGQLRYPSVNVADMRISRVFTFRERFKLDVMADLFNLGNVNTITAEVASYGANYLKPTGLVNPFVARFGLKLEF